MKPKLLLVSSKISFRVSDDDDYNDDYWHLLASGSMENFSFSCGVNVTREVNNKVLEALEVSTTFREFCNNLETSGVGYQLDDSDGLVVLVDGLMVSSDALNVSFEEQYSAPDYSQSMEFLKIQNHRMWN